MKYVAGVGRINVDLIFGGLPRLPEEGEEIYGDSFGMYLGGGTPASLINLARLGVPAKLGTYLGDDTFCDFAKAELEKSGVDYMSLPCDGYPINITAAALTERDRTFVSYGSDEDTLEIANKDFIDTLCGAEIVIMRLGQLELYRNLKSKNVKMVFDTGYSPDMRLADYAPYLELCDYYLPNRKEAMLLTGTDSVEDAARVLHRYLSTVVIKLDRDGTYVFDGESGIIIPPVKGVVQVDGTGAGDAFLSGFVYGMYHGYDLRVCVAAGNLTGARCVTAKGCLTAYYEKEELEIALSNFIFN